MKRKEGRKKGRTEERKKERKEKMKEGRKKRRKTGKKKAETESQTLWQHQKHKGVNQRSKYATQNSLECWIFQAVAKRQSILKGRQTKEINPSSELRSCVKVEVDVLGSPSLIVFTVSVDLMQH